MPMCVTKLIGDRNATWAKEIKRQSLLVAKEKGKLRRAPVTARDKRNGNRGGACCRER
jgi:predicted deacetylase